MSSKLTGSEWIWRDGEFVRWEDAQVHVLSTAVQFGSSVFEGLRCYDTERGPAVFRLRAHIRRLFDSCRTYWMVPDYSPDQLESAVLEVVRKNGLTECYVRPMVLRGFGAAGLYPFDSPIETYVSAWPWGAYLGAEALSQGVDVCVSTWHRAAPNTYPMWAKAAGHYNNAQLMKIEAVRHGYAEAIALAPSGLVSEGSGQNLFLVRDGALVTPVLDGTSLAGITRASVIELAADAGIEVHQQPVPREALYAADEMFFTGTASEVTPIRSVDGITIGEGAAGPVTLDLQRRFLAVARGQAEDPRGWVTYVS